MKGFSLWQPWASAMALGVKTIETRAYKTNYRGDLAICAAKRPIDMGDWKLVELLGVDVAKWEPPYGCVLCVVEVFSCASTEHIYLGGPSRKQTEWNAEYLLGNYNPGRYGWRTRNLRRLKNPVPVLGKQCMFNLTAEIEAQVIKEIG